MLPANPNLDFQASYYLGLYRSRLKRANEAVEAAKAAARTGPDIMAAVAAARVESAAAVESAVAAARVESAAAVNAAWINSRLAAETTIESALAAANVESTKDTQAADRLLLGARDEAARANAALALALASATSQSVRVQGAQDTLDSIFTSLKAAIAPAHGAGYVTPTEPLHYNKDRSLNMTYTTSRIAVEAANIRALHNVSLLAIDKAEMEAAKAVAALKAATNQNAAIESRGGNVPGGSPLPRSSVRYSQVGASV